MNGFRAAVKAAMGAGGVNSTPGTPEKPATAPENEKEGKEMRCNKISEMPSPPLSRWWTAASSAEPEPQRTKTTVLLTWICPLI